MNKKDRIAIVITGIPFILGLIGITEGGIVMVLPVLTYWGYRFIKNDISFLKTKGEN